MASGEIRSISQGTGAGEGKPLAVRLEQGEIAYYAVPPVQLVTETDCEFLTQQRVAGSSGRHIVFDPHTGELNHLADGAAENTTQLRRILTDVSGRAITWLGDLLRQYARNWQLGSMTLRPEEEATRRLRFSQREDLLHIDPFPEGASRGRRLLRCFVNLNSTERRVWATSDVLARILDRFGNAPGFPALDQASWTWQVRQGVWQLLDAKQRGRSAADDFLLRLHDYLKLNDQLQERGPKRFWHFAPRSAWLVMTDGLSHSVLRGRHALEMSIFVDPDSLACPELAPVKLVEGLRKPAETRRAA
jgi:hypothetical protein